MGVLEARRSALRALLTFLRRGVVEDGDADELFSLLQPVLDASGMVLAQDLDMTAWNYFSRVPEAWREHHARYRHQDPSPAFLGASPPGTIYFGRPALTGALRETELGEGFTRLGYGDVAITRLYNPFRDDLFCVLYRQADQAPFDDDDRLLLELLYPHLAAALAARRALGVLGLESPQAARRLHISYPEGRVTWSEGARRLTRERFGDVGSIGHTRFERVILAAARSFTSLGGGRSISLGHGLRLELAIVPPRPAESARLLGFLLVETPELRTLGSPMNALLSPRQLSVARAATTGMTIAAIAEQHRLSPETVRSHLRAAYAKLGVRSRAELSAALGDR